jgi:hypothetical protein
VFSADTRRTELCDIRQYSCLLTYLKKNTTLGRLCTNFHWIMYRLILFSILLAAHLVIILANNQLDALFHVFIYFTSLHVSSITVPIIRRSNCINTSSVMISLCNCLVCRRYTGIPRSEVPHALRTGRRWVSGLHFDWRWNMGFSPHSWIQAKVTAVAPYAFPQTFAFGGTLDRRCHFKHVSLKQSRFNHCQTSKAHR